MRKGSSGFGFRYLRAFRERTHSPGFGLLRIGQVSGSVPWLLFLEAEYTFGYRLSIGYSVHTLEIHILFTGRSNLSDLGYEGKKYEVIRANRRRFMRFKAAIVGCMCLLLLLGAVVGCGGGGQTGGSAKEEKQSPPSEPTQAESTLAQSPIETIQVNETEM